MKPRSKEKYSTLPLFPSPNPDNNTKSPAPYLTSPNSSNPLLKPPHLIESPELHELIDQNKQYSVDSRRSSSVGKKKLKKEASLFAGGVMDYNQANRREPRNFPLVQETDRSRQEHQRQHSQTSKRSKKKNTKQNTLFNPNAQSDVGKFMNPISVRPNNLMGNNQNNNNSNDNFSQRSNDKNSNKGKQAKDNRLMDALISKKPQPQQQLAPQSFNDILRVKPKVQQQAPSEVYSPYRQQESTVNQVLINKSPAQNFRMDSTPSPVSVVSGEIPSYTKPFALGIHTDANKFPKAKQPIPAGPSMNFMNAIKNQIPAPTNNVTPSPQYNTVTSAYQRETFSDLSSPIEDSRDDRSRKREKKKLGQLIEESRLNKSKESKMDNTSRLSSSIEKSQRVKPRLGDMIRESREKKSIQNTVYNSKNNTQFVYQSLKPDAPKTTFSNPTEPTTKFNPEASKLLQASKINMVQVTKKEAIPVEYEELSISDSSIHMSANLIKPAEPAPKEDPNNIYGSYCNKMSVLKYSQSPPKADPLQYSQSDHNRTNSNANSQHPQDSLFFQLENDPISNSIHNPQKKKKGLTMISGKQPNNTEFRQNNHFTLDASEVNSQKSGSKERHKKAKESSLMQLAKPSNQKYFDFQIQNSPNRPNDSFYAQQLDPPNYPKEELTSAVPKQTILVDKPMLSKLPETVTKPVTQILQKKNQAPPKIITFDDQNQSDNNPWQAAGISKTTDNFYPTRVGAQSTYEPSLASSLGRPPRPPSSRKSSKDSSLMSVDSRQSSRDNQLLAQLNINKGTGGGGAKKMTLNEIAEARKKNKPVQSMLNDEETETRSRKSSNSKKKDGCLMGTNSNQGGYLNSNRSSISRDSSEEYYSGIQNSDKRSQASKGSSTKKTKKDGTLLNMAPLIQNQKKVDSTPQSQSPSSRLNNFINHQISNRELSSQAKKQIIRTNCYHIDETGKLVKGEVYIPVCVSGEKQKQQEEDYFKSGYSNEYSYKFTMKNNENISRNGSVKSGRSNASKKSKDKGKNKINLLIDNPGIRPQRQAANNKQNNTNRNYNDSATCLQESNTTRFQNPMGALNRLPTSYSKQSTGVYEQDRRNSGSRKNLEINTLTEFIKGPKQQGPTDYHLQEYYMPKEEEYYEEWQQEQEVERLNYNQMFARNNTKRNNKSETPKYMQSAPSNYYPSGYGQNAPVQDRSREQRKMKRTER